jgi:predicted acylesterase/phospholipase RssA
MTPDGQVVRAMVLSGGSAYAAYQVGVLKALLRGESGATGYEPLNPDVYVGTSGGGFNAAFMVSQPGLDTLATLSSLEQVWVDQLAADPATCREGAIRIRGDVSQYNILRCLASNPVLPLSRIAEDTTFFARDFLTRAAYAVAPPPRPLGRRALEFADATALISIEVFVRVMHQVIDLAGIRTSDKALRLATTNWRTGEVCIFANEDMSDQIGHAAIEASIAFPGLRPVWIEGEPYVDGGYLLNTPLRPAVAAGSDELHVVFMDPDIRDIPVREFDNAFDVVDKLYHVMQAAFLNWNITIARQANQAIDFIDQGRFDASQARGIVDLIGGFLGPTGVIETPLRQLVIHIYHPRENIGGTLGLLNFDRGHITGLIAKGYADAISHDCVASGCIVPDGGVGRAGYRPSVIMPRVTERAYAT